MDLVGFIRTLAILLILWWAYRFFVEKGRQSKEAAREKQAARKPPSAERKQLKDDVGEYVDYEEVK
jgi:hypothetical protein